MPVETQLETRVFAARMACLPDALAFTEGFCVRHGVAHVDRLRMELVVEELFTNTVAHGHGGDCDAPIALKLSLGVAGLALLYEDIAPPFDLPARLAEHPLAGHPTQPGGVGIHLVAQLAASLRYLREDARNRLWIVLRAER